MVRCAHFFAAGLAALLLNACAIREATSPMMPTVVETVIIEKNAAWSDDISSDEPPGSCSDFVLTVSDVQTFFRVARKATHTEYNHDLLMSRCYASGRLILDDGSTALWRIDRARRGRLAFPDNSIRFFFCAECRNEAYGEPCDIDCIHAE